jgi:hypothetical protein
VAAEGAFPTGRVILGTVRSRREGRYGAGPCRGAAAASGLSGRPAQDGGQDLQRVVLPWLVDPWMAS